MLVVTAPTNYEASERHTTFSQENDITIGSIGGMAS